MSTSSQNHTDRGSEIGRRSLWSANVVVIAALVVALIWALVVFLGVRPALEEMFVGGLSVIVAGLAAGLSYVASREIREEHRSLQDQQETLRALRDEARLRSDFLRDQASARREATAFIAQHIGTVAGHLNAIAGRMAAAGLMFDSDGNLRADVSESSNSESSDITEESHAAQMPLITVPARLNPIVRSSNA